MKPNAFPLPSRHRAFTLAEMAVVLIIIGSIIGVVYPALIMAQKATATTTTEANLKTLMQSVTQYVQSNGCLPCPSNATAVGTGFGHVRGDSTASPSACGTCSTPEGIAPFISMGLPPSVAKDGYGHWITMRVDPALTVNFGIIPPTVPCTSTDVTNGVCTSTQVGYSQKGLCKSGLSTANRINVIIPNGATSQAAVILVSHGTRGQGAFIASVTANGLNGSRYPFTDGTPSCSSTAGYARCNADNNTTFYEAERTGVDSTDFYDNRLAYADRNTLVSALGNGPCQTSW